LCCSLISRAGIPAYTLPPVRDLVTPVLAANVEWEPISTCGATPTWPAKVQYSPTQTLPAIVRAAVKTQPLPNRTLCAK
jgi:hypothetical protein